MPLGRKEPAVLFFSCGHIINLPANFMPLMTLDPLALGKVPSITGGVISAIPAEIFFPDGH